MIEICPQDESVSFLCSTLVVSDTILSSTLLSSFQIRIELENPLTNNLRDTIVMVTCLRRLNGISARGTEAKAASDAVSQMNANETRVPSNGTLIKTCLGNGGKNGVDKSLIRKHIEPVMNGSTKKLPRPAPADELTNGVKLQEVLIKPPNDLLLEMIGTRCLLTRLLVRPGVFKSIGK